MSVCLCVIVVMVGVGKLRVNKELCNVPFWDFFFALSLEYYE